MVSFFSNGAFFVIISGYHIYENKLFRNYNIFIFLFCLTLSFFSNILKENVADQN